MFIDTGYDPSIRAPAERNVRPDEYGRSAMFRSSGARRIFLNLYSINISSLWDEELCRTLTSSYIPPEKQTLLVCFKGQQNQEQSTKFKVQRSKSKTKVWSNHDYSVPARRNNSFIPAMLWRVDSSGVPAPRQCVSRLTIPLYPSFLSARYWPT